MTSILNTDLKKTIFSQSGQIGLIAILVMVVGLTVGLGVVSRSITDVSISETEEKSLRAFNAAEAGIEELLKEASLTPGVSSISVGGLDAQVEVTESRKLITSLEQNETAEVDLRGASANQVKILWVDKDSVDENPTGPCSEGDGTAPASLEIIKYRATETGGNVTSVEPYHYLYNSYGCSLSNNFSTTSSGGASNYLSQATVSIDGSLDDVLRIRPIYNKTTIEVVGMGGQLPVQKHDIISEAADPDSGEKRSVSAGRTIRAWPPIFDYAMFSGTTIIK